MPHHLERYGNWADLDGDGDIDFDDVRTGVRREWTNFLDFALRDNVLEVAVGLIFAACFTACATSLVSDIILPIVSLLPFLDRNLQEKFIILRPGDQKSCDYNTVKQALDDGALVWAWGSFLDKLMRFFLIAFVLFLISRLYSVLAHDNIIKKQVKCKYCRKWISEHAKRCFNCTTWMDGREDPKASVKGGAAPLVEIDED